MPRVTVFRGAEVLIGFHLAEKPLTLGRGQEADVVVPDKRLSRRHCQIELAPGGVLVTDLGSTNGVFYKGERMPQIRLGDADEFFMGDVRVALEPEKLKMGTLEFSTPGEETVAGVSGGEVDRMARTVPAGPPPGALGALGAHGQALGHAPHAAHGQAHVAPGHVSHPASPHGPGNQTTRHHAPAPHAQPAHPPSPPPRAAPAPAFPFSHPPPPGPNSGGMLDLWRRLDGATAELESIYAALRTTHGQDHRARESIERLKAVIAEITAIAGS